MDPGAAAPGPPPPSSDSDPTDHPTSPPQHHPPPQQQQQQPSSSSSSQHPSRYESQKRRDWNTFLQYLTNHKPPLTLALCSGANVIEFLKYLDQFGKTKVHNHGCEYFGQANPPASCPCPLKQAWGSLDALIGRLRAAYEESGGKPESNPFGARAVRIYLREVKENQAKARGIPYEKRKRKRATAETSSDTAATAETTELEGEGPGAPREGGDKTPSTPPASAAS